MTKVRRTKAEKRLRRELDVAWFLAGAADAANLTPKLRKGGAYFSDNAKHQEFYTESSTSSLNADVPSFQFTVWADDESGLPERFYKVTVEEVTA